MRIAVTGAHGVGKTTLTEDLHAARGRFEIVPEPWLLFPEGSTAFLEGPTVADLEEQLSQSCALLLESVGRTGVVFDRCPLDYLAYLDVVSEEEGFEWTPHARLMARIDRALRALDLLVFVPLARPDVIRAPIEHGALRRRVDDRLRRMLRDDDLGLAEMGLRVLTVVGARDRRLATLLAALPEES